jgi:uncharacterized protein YkwD
MRFSLPASPRTEQYRAILPGAVKRAYLIVIVLFAIASGRGQLAIHAQEITPQIGSIPTVRPAQQGILPAHTARPVQQIAVIAIGKQKFIAPTSAPVLQVQGSSTASGGSYALLQALNNYRQKNGKSPLRWDSKLGAFAQQRADHFHQINDLDGHAGFTDMVNNHDGFHTMGFLQLGENSAIGQTVGPQEIIENVYGKSPAHNANELSAEFTHVGIGVNGTATNFVFGGRRL